jgi:hypothetical protein
MSNQGDLYLGLRMTRNNAPAAWRDGPPITLQDQDMYLVPANAFACHSILFAQSGSGKTTLVSRIVEELAIATEANIVIIDPNSDYRNIDTVDPKSFDSNDYDTKTELGKLTHDTLSDFSNSWNTVTCQNTADGYPRVPINLLDAALISSASPADSKFDIQCCFKYVIRLHQLLCDLNNIASAVAFDTFSRQLQSCTEIVKEDIEDHISTVSKMHSLENLEKDPTQLNVKKGQCEIKFGEFMRDVESLKPFYNYSVAQRIIFTIRDHELLFSAQANSYIPFLGSQISVLDVPSMPDDTKLTLIKTWIDAIWKHHEELFKKKALTVPTYVVIDEAHNFLPSQVDEVTGQKVILETLRRIAAEGRKYGIFLFLITQRPDKLDPLTISECQNKFIMRVGSERALVDASSILGFSPQQISDLVKAVNFQMGRAFVVGPAADHSKIADVASPSGVLSFYTMTRRTEQGSPSLPAKWYLVNRK